MEDEINDYINVYNQLERNIERDLGNLKLMIGIKNNKFYKVLKKNSANEVNIQNNCIEDVRNELNSLLFYEKKFRGILSVLKEKRKSLSYRKNRAKQILFKQVSYTIDESYIRNLDLEIIHVEELMNHYDLDKLEHDTLCERKDTLNLELENQERRGMLNITKVSSIAYSCECGTDEDFRNATSLKEKIGIIKTSGIERADRGIKNILADISKRKEDLKKKNKETNELKLKLDMFIENMNKIQEEKDKTIHHLNDQIELQNILTESIATITYEIKRNKETLASIRLEKEQYARQNFTVERDKKFTKKYMKKLDELKRANEVKEKEIEQKGTRINEKRCSIEAFRNELEKQEAYLHDEEIRVQQLEEMVQDKRDRFNDTVDDSKLEINSIKEMASRISEGERSRTMDEELCDIIEFED